MTNLNDLAAKVESFLQIVDDFGNMGGGEFRRKYPDQDQYEGYLYVQRKGREVHNALRARAVGRGK